MNKSLVETYKTYFETCPSFLPLKTLHVLSHLLSDSWKPLITGTFRPLRPGFNETLIVDNFGVALKAGEQLAGKRGNIGTLCIFPGILDDK